MIRAALLSSTAIPPITVRNVAISSTGESGAYFLGFDQHDKPMRSTADLVDGAWVSRDAMKVVTHFSGWDIAAPVTVGGYVHTTIPIAGAIRSPVIDRALRRSFEQTREYLWPRDVLWGAR